jgi:hypothetical protein
MKNIFKLSNGVLWGALALICTLPVFGAWTDEKPDSSPVKTDSSTCVGTRHGSCHKEQIDSCRCVDCPGLQEQFPGCDCVQQTGTAYWQAWDGNCRGRTYTDEFGVSITFYHCEFSSEPQQSGDKSNQPNCGRAS